LEAGVDEFDGEHERRGVAPEGVIERRQHTRYAVDAWAEVMVKDGTVLFRGRVLDISVAGCYVATEARLRLAPGTWVEMVFRVDERVLRCDAMCRMTRKNGAGFLFKHLDGKTRAQVDQLVGELAEAS
jgi:hypothetical protein